MYALMTRKTCALYRVIFATMHDLVLHGVCPWARKTVMADFGRRSLLLFRTYSIVSQSPVAGFTTPRLCWSAWTSLASKKITRIAMISWTLFAASCVCHCCLPPTSRHVCKRFVRPSAMTCRRLGSYSSWWRTFSVTDRRRDFHGLVGHVSQMQSLYASTACWCGSGAMQREWVCSFLTAHQHKKAI